MEEKLKILVVDDERDAADMFREILTKKGYDVTTALSGVEAIEAVDNSDIDVVLLDIRMPGMDGIETLAKLKEKKPSLSVIMITAYGYDDNFIDKTLQLGASGYISKNMPLSQILDTFRTIVSMLRRKR